MRPEEQVENLNQMEKDLKDFHELEYPELAKRVNSMPDGAERRAERAKVLEKLTTYHERYHKITQMRSNLSSF